MTTLTLQVEPQAPLEAGCICPDIFRNRPESEIGNLTVMHGNERAALADFFKVDGQGSEEIVVNGDLSRVKNIGSGMSSGSIRINGDSGMHLGSAMRGGQVDVFGNAGDWTGAEMKGGKIHIRGNAGHCLGGAYRGSRYGMNRGFIIVEGHAGNEAGAAMRRGLIVVCGSVGDFAGAFMIAGSIFVFGKLGARAGAGLLRGTILSLEPAELLPTYRYDCTYRPSFLDYIFQNIRRNGIAVPECCNTGSFRRYSGDFNRLGKGEILIYDQR
jgi:formylmethanofuran dehydrogenase subunit C